MNINYKIRCTNQFKT